MTLITAGLPLPGGADAFLLSTVAAGRAAMLQVPFAGLVPGTAAMAPVIAIASLGANPSRAWLFRSGIQWQLIG